MQSHWWQLALGLLVPVGLWRVFVWVDGRTYGLTAVQQRNEAGARLVGRVGALVHLPVWPSPGDVPTSDPEELLHEVRVAAASLSQLRSHSTAFLRASTNSVVGRAAELSEVIGWTRRLTAPGPDGGVAEPARQVLDGARAAARQACDQLLEAVAEAAEANPPDLV